MPRTLIQQSITAAQHPLEDGEFAGQFIGVAVITKRFSDSYCEGWSLRAGNPEPTIERAIANAQAKVAQLKLAGVLEVPEVLDGPYIVDNTGPICE